MRLVRIWRNYGGTEEWADKLDREREGEQGKFIQTETFKFELKTVKWTQEYILKCVNALYTFCKKSAVNIVEINLVTMYARDILGSASKYKILRRLKRFSWLWLTF